MRISLVFLSLVLLIACNENNNYEDNIIGKWKVDSILNYYNGDEEMMKSSGNENLFVGSYSNPRYCDFTKHGEAFFYRANDEQKRVSNFEIKGDSIILQSITNCKILSLTHNNLVFQQELKINYYDKSVVHPKHILTSYSTKQNQ